MSAAQHSEGKLIKNNRDGRSFNLIDSLFLALLHYTFNLELQKVIIILSDGILIFLGWIRKIQRLRN